MSIVTRVKSATRMIAAVIATAFLGLSFAPVASADKVPVISGTPKTSIAVRTYYWFQARAHDPDGKSVHFGIKNKPAWATFNYNDGTLSGTPTSTGTWANIVIHAWDGRLTKNLPAFSIRVTGTSGGGTANRPPSITGAPASATTVGSTYAFAPRGADADGDSLGYSITNRPSWATFSTSTGELTGRPSSSHVGSYSNIVVRVSDGKLSTALAAFSIRVNAASGSSNAAPTISGSPVRAVSAGVAYSFTPTARDANSGDTLTFSIANRPSWATFNTTTGRLSGTPTAAQVGTYSNIQVRVGDGRASAALATFSIAVNAASSSSGAATLSWTPPTRNTDGSSLTNLGGYRIYYGTSSTALTRTISIGSGLSTYMVDDLSPATYYFAISAINVSGAESSRSSVVAKVVR